MKSTFYASTQNVARAKTFPMPDSPDGIWKIFAHQLDAAATWMNHHGVIAWIILIFVVIALLTKPWFEALDIWKFRIVHPIAKHWKFRWAVRAANKYGIRGYANAAISDLAPQLPQGWISELEIKWVDNETRQQFFENGKIVVRMRPLHDQDLNFVNVIHMFLQEALFPSVRNIIPELQRTAAILHFGSRISARRSRAAADVYGERIFEPIVAKKKKVLHYFKRYGDIDEVGLFSGAFIREVQHIAREVRATNLRDNMSAEMNAVLTHLEDFAKGYAKSQSDGVSMPPSVWSRNGITTKYALLLVANPSKAAVDDEGAGYVSRAIKCKHE